MNKDIDKGIWRKIASIWHLCKKGISFWVYTIIKLTDKNERPHAVSMYLSSTYIINHVEQGNQAVNVGGIYTCLKYLILLHTVCTSGNRK